MKYYELVYPIVKTIKNKITTQNPISDTSYKDTAKGNRNNTSKSKTINRIATKQNCTENFCRASPRGVNPPYFLHPLFYEKKRGMDGWTI